MDPAQRANVEILQELEARPFTGASGGTGLPFGASTVVWRPGAPSAGNVYATWAEVVAAVAKLNGDITIGLDTDLAAAVIPPGNYDLRPVGVSGPVTIVNASKAPPFTAPFVTLGPGAVTIKGLTGLDDAQVDNQSTVPVIAVTATASFAMHGRAVVFQEPAAGPFWAITAGDYDILMSDFSSITTPGGGTPAVTVAAPGTLGLGIFDVASFDVNMLVDAVGVYAALGANRVVGTPAGAGSFQITALLSGGAGGAVNGADTSTAIDWEILAP